MSKIKRTIRVTGLPEDVRTFDVPMVNQRTIGQYVTSKVIYDLKRRGVSTVEFPDKTVTFEVMP